MQAQIKTGQTAWGGRSSGTSSVKIKEPWEFKVYYETSEIVISTTSFGKLSMPDQGY